MRSCFRVATSALAIFGFLALASASARADGIVVRGETLMLGAAPPALPLEDGRTVDLSRLIQAVDPQPPYRPNDLLVYDLSTLETTLGNGSAANRSLLAELGGGAILLGAVLDEPGDVLYFESAPTGPDDFVHADRFLLVDAFDGRQRLWSNPAVPAPEPSTSALLAAGLAALAGGRTPLGTPRSGLNGPAARRRADVYARESTPSEDRPMSTDTTQNRLLAEAYGNPLIEAQGPQQNPGELTNWPMLKVSYRTDKDRIAALLPPGLEPDDSSLVLITFYNVPIQNAPEYGIAMNVAANYKGTAGEYTLGIGINQETVIFPSKERWGQPKFHADTAYWRLGNTVEARTTHYGHTFAEFVGTVVGQQEPLPEAEQREFWVKYLRDCDLTPGKYDFPPHFVNVYSKFGTAHLEKVEGELILRESKWDPIATLLPLREQVSAHLWTPIFLDRKITLGDPIDPDKFWPHADTIGGARWPGENGAPPAV